MRILIISDLLAYGGASKLISDLLPRLKNRGHYCELLILTDEHSKYMNNMQNNGIRVTVVPKDIKGHVGKILFIRNYIRQGMFDVVHANLFPVIYYISIIKFIDKKCPPIIMTEHSTDNKRRHKKILRPLEQFIYRQYDRIVSISNQTEVQLLKWLKCKKDSRFKLIENGIDLEHFKSAVAYDKKVLFPEYKLGDVLMVMVGSFLKQKNHHNMIFAMKELPENFKLILVGEGPLEEEIRTLVKEKKLLSRVVFLGFRTDVAEIMHTCDVLVIPSLWEGFGLIAAEGMASGISIVASDVEGLADVVGDCGLKFNPMDSANVAEIIRNVIAGDLREEMIAKGKNRANLYDINRFIREYEKIYSEVGYTK